MGPSMEDMNRYTFVDERVMSLEDRVAVSIRRLQSNEPTESIASSVGVNESIILLVTERFVEAMWEPARHHSNWTDSSEKDQIKSYNMHNCCGVICTTRIPFGPNHDSENNCSVLMQVIIDPEMRFRNIWFGPAGRLNHLNRLYDSELFQECEKGTWLNGSKLKVALDGPEVGEYIIGDAGYPLLPWLLTPYRLEDKDLLFADFPPYQAEFNRRHAAASTIMTAALARLKDNSRILDRH